MDNIILAIDLGKYKSVACVLDESSGEYRFTTFDTSGPRVAARIVECTPRRHAPRHRARISRHPCRDRGLIAAPWTPASLSLLPPGRPGARARSTR